MGGLVDKFCDFNYFRAIRKDAGTPFAAIDFDQDMKAMSQFPALVPDRTGHLYGVGNQGDLGAGALDRGDALQLVGDDADGILHIGDAVSREVLGLLEGRDRDPSRLTRQCQARHLNRLRGLQVGPQGDAITFYSLRHALDVPDESCPVENQ
jgi:hypothetical protein